MDRHELLQELKFYPTLAALKSENEGLYKQIGLSGGNKALGWVYDKSEGYKQADNVILIYRVQGMFESYIGLISTNKSAYERHIGRLDEFKRYDPRTKFTFLGYRKLTLHRHTSAMLCELLREDNLPPNKAFHFRFDTALDPWIIDRLNNYNPTLYRDDTYWEVPKQRIIENQQVHF